MDVLLIEPDSLLAKSYISQLGAYGLNIRRVADAASAIEAIDQASPSLVILEIKLSGHSGVEFLHEFRSYEDWASIPVVVYSSVPKYAFGLEDSMWAKLGVACYLEKSKTSIARLAMVVNAEAKHANNS